MAFYIFSMTEVCKYLSCNIFSMAPIVSLHVPVWNPCLFIRAGQGVNRWQKLLIHFVPCCNVSCSVGAWHTVCFLSCPSLCPAGGLQSLRLIACAFNAAEPSVRYKLKIPCRAIWKLRGREGAVGIRWPYWHSMNTEEKSEWQAFRVLPCVRLRSILDIEHRWGGGVW